ncbi:hypothetical protein F4782DRAFT_544712 [Xylaria castorea]|nr:hypothetical protein F4782DRAFT_544712 [Xylaria castorea]
MADASDSESGNGSCSDASSPVTCWDCLGDSLDRIESICDFAAMKRYQRAPNPVLQVGGEIITLPLDDHGVKSIRKLGRQAPFEKGNQTVVDVVVRRTWELNVDEYCIKNPAWISFVTTLMNDVCFGNLGIAGEIRAELHKVLLYEPGSFFKAHKDSQKAEGMIATLAICLPSEHKGGEVHLSYAGQHRTFDTSESSLFDTTALTWYSDVTHEVRKVVSGHRLVLTYNIMHKSGSKYSAGTFNQQLDTVNRALTQCRLQDLHFQRKIYPLDHKYSRAGLSLRGLKGRDRAVCQSLYKLCSQHGLYLLLGNMTKERSIDPHTYDDKDAEVDLVLNVINGPDGANLVNDILFEEDQLIRDPYSDREEDSFEGSDNLGNEGSLEIFKYYDSAAIICPKDDLASYLRLDGVNIRNMMLMLMQDIEENPKTIGATSDSLAVLEMIVKSEPGRFKSPCIYASMIEWAWKHEHQSLYTTSVLSSISDTMYRGVGMKTVAKIINADISEAKEKIAVQWDKYLDGVIDGIYTLDVLAECLTAVENAIIGSLKPAFSTWKFVAQQKLFNSKTCLNMGDKQFIISRLDNSDWLAD